jgi:hypothetical protein
LAREQIQRMGAEETETGLTDRAAKFGEKNRKLEGTIWSDAELKIHKQKSTGGGPGSQRGAQHRRAAQISANTTRKTKQLHAKIISTDFKFKQNMFTTDSYLESYLTL